MESKCVDPLVPEKVYMQCIMHVHTDLAAKDATGLKVEAYFIQLLDLVFWRTGLENSHAAVKGDSSEERKLFTV